MAQIEQLVASIADKTLGDQIAREVKALKERKQFGLVFERHLPETVLIAADAKIRAGSRARRRTTPDGPDLVVVRATRRSVTVAGDEGELELPRDELMIVQPFEQPVYPTLRHVRTVARSDERPYHAVINGENFHALQLLVHAYEGQADCIYIDPPTTPAPRPRSTTTASSTRTTRGSTASGCRSWRSASGSPGVFSSRTAC